MCRRRLRLWITDGWEMGERANLYVRWVGEVLISTV